MNPWRIIFLRELVATFSSPIAAIFLVVFLTGSGLLTLFFFDYFAVGVAEMRIAFLAVFPLLLTVLVPAITMRIWAEERRSGSEELLMTLPMSDLALVASKFLAAFAFILVALLLTFPLPWVLKATVEPTLGVDWGPVITGYFGTALLAAAYLAIGCAISAAAGHQMVAFIVTLTVLVLLTVPRLVAPNMPDLNVAVQRWIRILSLSSYMNDLSKGVINLRDVAFFFSVIAACLHMNLLLLGRRRWG